MTETLTILGAAFAALLGAWAGARTALSRFKKERAFDVRLEWYKGVIELLHSAALEIKLLGNSVTNPRDTTDFQQGVTLVAERVKALREMIVLGFLFADETTLEAIQRAGALDRTRLAGLKGEALALELKKLQLFYENAAVTAAIKGREHLGIEKLKALRSLELPGSPSLTPTGKPPGG